MEIEIRGLRVERGKRCVLQVEHLVFAAGTTTAVFGPNGAGKTTLLRAIAALERPLHGNIRVGSVFVSGTRALQQDIALAFQRPVAVRGTVRDNLLLALQLRRVPAEAHGERIDDVALQCGIAPLLERRAQSLSGGELQRLNLARALVLRAPVTLLDEPLAGLDRPARARLLDDLPCYLAGLGATALIVTHDREEAFRLAEHIVILSGGCVIAAGRTTAIYASPPNPETAELLGYTLIPVGDDLIAVAPGELRIGRGALDLTLLPERIVTVGSHEHVVGRINEKRVDVRLHLRDEVQTGVPVCVNARSFVRFTAESQVGSDEAR